MVATLYVKYRPLRIGFLIKENSIDELIAAAKINTLLWGGIYNPIIPVSQNRDHMDQLIKVFSVDLLYSVNKSDEFKNIIESYQYLWPPFFGKNTLTTEDWQSKKQKIRYLDVSHIIDYHWEKEFRHSEKSNCKFPVWSDDDEYSNVFNLMFGNYPKDLDLLNDYEKAFKNGLKAEVVEIGQDAQLINNLFTSGVPISITSDRLLIATDHFRRGEGLYFGHANEFSDLLFFWNMRATGTGVKFFPIDNNVRFAEALNHYISVLDKKPDHHPTIKDDIWVYHRKEQEKIKAILSSFNTKKKLLYSCLREDLWDGVNIKTEMPHFEDKSVLAMVENKYDRPSLSFPFPQSPLSNEDYDSGMQELVVSVKSLTEFEYLGHTLKLPFIPDLNEFFAREIALDPFELRVEKDGIGLIKRASSESATIFPLLTENLISKIFERAGIKNKMSQAGLLTKHIINKMGGLDNCRAFKINGVRELIKATDKKGVEWGQATRTIFQNDFGRYTDLYIEPRKKRKLKSSDVWLHLLKNKVFVPELKWQYRIIPHNMLRDRQYSCKNCGLVSDVPIADFSGDWTCGCCGHKQYLPIYLGQELRNMLYRWSFKKSGLFERKNNQEGAIPVILTIMQLARLTGHDAKWMTSMMLKLDGLKNCEIDYVVMDNSERWGKYSIDMVIGESKDKGGEINDADIENMKQVKNMLDRSGINCYIAFSKTADEFDPAELERFKRLVGEGITPILFTNIELEPYDPYFNHPKRHLLIHEYAHGFEEIAENSKSLYLS